MYNIYSVIAVTVFGSIGFVLYVDGFAVATVHHGPKNHLSMTTPAAAAPNNKWLLKDSFDFDHQQLEHQNSIAKPVDGGGQQAAAAGATRSPMLC